MTGKYRWYKAVLLILLGCVTWFYLDYVRVSPEIMNAFEQKDASKLKNIAMDQEKFNWFQRAEAAEYYSSLVCASGDPYVVSLLGENNISMRRAVLEGCYTDSKCRELPQVLQMGLSDSYSYNRWQTLRYLRKCKLENKFKKRIKELSESDTSSMVRREAAVLLKQRESVSRSSTGDN
jgi:hypothetical protein